MALDERPTRPLYFFTWHLFVVFDEAWPGEKGFVDQDKLERLLLNGEGGQETTELVTSLNRCKKDRRFVVSRVLKNEKNRA